MLYTSCFSITYFYSIYYTNKFAEYTILFLCNIESSYRIFYLALGLFFYLS